MVWVRAADRSAYIGDKLVRLPRRVHGAARVRVAAALPGTVLVPSAHGVGQDRPIAHVPGGWNAEARRLVSKRGRAAEAAAGSHAAQAALWSAQASPEPWHGAARQIGRWPRTGWTAVSSSCRTERLRRGDVRARRVGAEDALARSNLAVRRKSVFISSNGAKGRRAPQATRGAQAAVAAPRVAQERLAA